MEKLIGSVGGTVEAFYYAFGDTDLYIITDVPDNVSMAALAWWLMLRDGHHETVVLLTPEDIDQAVKKTPTYRAPGQ